MPDLPHLATQHGSHRATMVFGDDDYALHRDLLAAKAARARVDAWAGVLMPHHGHLILVPANAMGLAAALSHVHRRYAASVDARA